MRNHLTQQETLLAEMVTRVAVTPNREEKTTKKKKNLGLQLADRLKSKFLARLNDTSETEGSGNSIDKVCHRVIT